MPLLDLAFAGLAPWAFWGGVLLLVLGVLVGEASPLALFLLYPWWRLGRGWRFRLFPDRLHLQPPLGLSRTLPLDQIQGVEEGFWPAGPLSRGRRVLFLLLWSGERLPLPLPNPGEVAERLKELLAGRTSGNGSPDG
ncbi:MAG: hypothetical protein NZ846_01440 [Thermus sp.]|uniref:hypothetical protein n=1 Tax=Thermus sp. TaxID=275 RepID=UPI0025D67E18|nr:hypothetical protein [Thermus sp.]MCS6867565.1 hypothetical protein [Thermus sp.]MCS7217635.1 hypothetical protein [Thermus sp.]MCX7849374.1 hypothetical protein [Thermus sp.]MDW8017152.1 hypothetical protein [Thermus sp.]MDW8357973.1 hypothetical protein [Thermus sp.]